MSTPIIFIAGIVAAGKSTFARHLSKELRIPCALKDDIKEILADSIGFANREENLRLSRAAFELLLYAIKKSLYAQKPIIAESNFRPHEAEEIKELFRSLDAAPITVLFTGEMHVMYNRYIAREPERHSAHRSGAVGDYDSFSNGVKNLSTFDIGGPRLLVDTTDFSMVNYASIVSFVKEEINIRYTK